MKPLPHDDAVQPLRWHRMTCHTVFFTRLAFVLPDLDIRPSGANVRRDLDRLCVDNKEHGRCHRGWRGLGEQFGADNALEMRLSPKIAARTFESIGPPS